MSEEAREKEAMEGMSEKACGHVLIPEVQDVDEEKTLGRRAWDKYFEERNSVTQEEYHATKQEAGQRVNSLAGVQEELERCIEAFMQLENKSSAEGMPLIQRMKELYPDLEIDRNANGRTDAKAQPWYVLMAYLCCILGFEILPKTDHRGIYQAIVVCTLLKRLGVSWSNILNGQATTLYSEVAQLGILCHIQTYDVAAKGNSQTKLDTIIHRATELANSSPEFTPLLKFLPTTKEAAGGGAAAVHVALDVKVAASALLDTSTMSDTELLNALMAKETPTVQEDRTWDVNLVEQMNPQMALELFDGVHWIKATGTIGCAGVGTVLQPCGPKCSKSDCGRAHNGHCLNSEARHKSIVVAMKRNSIIPGVVIARIGAKDPERARAFKLLFAPVA